MVSGINLSESDSSDSELDEAFRMNSSASLEYNETMAVGNENDPEF
jgi:hypothetical protein